MYKRFSGLLVVAIALVAFLLLWWSLGQVQALSVPDPKYYELFGIFTIAYSWEIPPLLAVFAAIVIGSSIAQVFSRLETWDLNDSRRSRSRQRKPLSPGLIIDETHGVFSGEVTITVLMPAHNEEAIVGKTLEILLTHEPPPNRVIVIADNCTDDTVAIAKSHGVEVIETHNNVDKKAGALNQVLRDLLPSMGPNDTVMVLDADSIPQPGFLATAIKAFTDDRGLSAVGGQFLGAPGDGLIGQLQRNEYLRYQREIDRRQGKVFVLTGTATIFRAQSLQCVASSRGTLIPGTPGSVYETESLTEDNELTIALKSLGALMYSPSGCEVETEVMPTWVTLWRQRLRWQRGAVSNIGHYGLTPTTTRYWSQQIGIAYSVFALWSFFLMIFLQITATDQWVWFPFWIAILGLFLTERLITVWRGGWKARLLSVFIVPELLFDSFQDVIFLKGITDLAFHRRVAWGHEIPDAAQKGAHG